MIIGWRVELKPPVTIERVKQTDQRRAAPVSHWQSARPGKVRIGKHQQLPAVSHPQVKSDQLFWLQQARLGHDQKVKALERSVIKHINRL